MGTRRDDRRFASIAIVGSVALHVLLAWLVLRHVMEAAPPPPAFIAVTMVQPLPPPKPVVPHKPVVKPPVAKHVAVPVPKNIIPAQPKTHMPQHSAAKRTIVAPVVPHFSAANADTGLGLNLPAPSAGTANGHGSLEGFDDSVRQRIEAAKTYPPGIPYIWNQCVVEYQVTVDRTGQLLSYSLQGCGQPFLDSAARAAILEASPYPVPPDFGGSQYIVFGSLVFKHH